MLCSGDSHGKCDCGKCKCELGWTGENCGCSTLTVWPMTLKLPTSSPLIWSINFPSNCGFRINATLLGKLKFVAEKGNANAMVACAIVPIRNDTRELTAKNAPWVLQRLYLCIYLHVHCPLLYRRVQTGARSLQHVSNVPFTKRVYLVVRMTHFVAGNAPTNIFNLLLWTWLQVLITYLSGKGEGVGTNSKYLQLKWVLSLCSWWEGGWEVLHPNWWVGREEVSLLLRLRLQLWGETLHQGSENQGVSTGSTNLLDNFWSCGSHCLGGDGHPRDLEMCNTYCGSERICQFWKGTDECQVGCGKDNFNI